MINNCHNKRCEYCGNIYDAKAPGTAEVKIFTYETDRSIADGLSMNVCPVCAERVRDLLTPNDPYCEDCEVKIDDTDMG